MSGHHSFSELTKDFTTERLLRIEEKRTELRAVMKYHESQRADTTIRKLHPKESRSTTAHDFVVHIYRVISLQNPRSQMARLGTCRKRYQKQHTLKHVIPII